MMILAFILVAMAFKARNTKPWRFILCLAFLCETSSFCVVVAGGIAACWLFEILKEGFLPHKWIRDKRIYSLFTLFVFALFLVMTILPPKDALFTSFLEGENSVLKCFFVALTTALSETLIYTSPWFSYETVTLAAAHINTGALIVGIVIQAIIVLHICCFSNKDNLKYFFIPYLFFCLFGAFVVLAAHYLGVGYCVFIFWLWINCEDDRHFEIGNNLADLLHFTDRDTALIKKFSVAFCALSLLIPLVWTISSSIKEIQFQYSYGRETVQFLEKTGLIDTKIAMSWDEEKTDSGDIDYDELDLKSNGWPVPLCAYADRNIVYNFNDGLDDAAYVQFIRQTAEQNRATIERWKRSGVPDVLLGDVDVELLTDGAVSIKDYAPVYKMRNNYIWKGGIYKSTQYIFTRNDLLDDYAITPIERPEGMFGYSGIEITDEIRERFENGEDINDILKPYLDYLFGEESASSS